MSQLLLTFENFLIIVLNVCENGQIYNNIKIPVLRTFIRICKSQNIYLFDSEFLPFIKRALF